MKRTLLTLLQLVITAGILFLLFRNPETRAEMANALRHADLRWLLAGIAISGAVEFIGGVRWQYLLYVQEIRLPWWRILALTIIGVFFNFIAPGGTGGDLVKTFYLMKETPGKRTLALLSVIMDRILGLLSVVVLAGIFITLRWDWLTSTRSTKQFVWTALAILAVAVAMIGASFLLSGLGLVHRLPARMPGRDRLAEFALAYNLYARAWKTTLAAFLASMIGNLGYFATFYCAARALAQPGMKLPSLLDMFAIMPVVNTIVSMPVSVGGVGVREGLFQVFVGGLTGVSGAVAVIISSTGFALTAFWGIVGGLVYLLYRPTDHARLAQIREEVGSFEHAVAESEVEMERLEAEEFVPPAHGNEHPRA